MCSQSKLDFQPLEKLDVLDGLVYQSSDCFYWDQDKIDQMQFKLIKEAYSYHYNGCMSYRNYSDTLNVSPADIKSHQDLSKIPLIPSTMFKLDDIITGSPKDVVKVCLSSGTKGSISKIYRDEKTLNRFLGSLQCSIDQIYCLDDAFCINLGPSSQEAGDLWFSFATSVVDMVFPTENFVIDDIFYPEKALGRLKEVLNNYENTIIIGAPIMFIELIDYMKKNNITINDCESIYFVTAGGWKRFSGNIISRNEFWQLVADRFINSKIENFRDTLNMVELNTILPECQFHNKHIVPWVKILIINPVNMKPVEDGEVGLIAYLDPSTLSYPCFVLTDDLGRLNINGNCKCGRYGQTLEVIRRVKSVESRGCALKIDKKYASNR